MDLQTRKLDIIGYLIGIQDEKTFNRIEASIRETQLTDNRKIKRFTKKQLIYRAKRANQDYIAGRFKTQEQLELESEKW